jgi:septum formation protein
MDKDRTYILASGSPRRIEMMKKHGIRPIVHPAEIDENIPPEHGMCQTVMFLALKKAKAVEAEYLASDGKAPIIIAADTIVYKDEIMGKPEDREDAFRMISSLRNDVHFVVTGCALVEAGMQNARVFAEITKVFVKDFSDEELNAYLDTDEPYDKAGAYAIQGIFSKHIDHIEGEYDNVVGFPWERIEKELTKL